MSRTLLVIFFATIFNKASTLEQLCTNEDIASKCICGYDTAHSSRRHYVVDCARTDLEIIPDIAQLPMHFTVLDISQNKVKYLGFDSVDFMSATLKVLNARYNEITEISGEFMRNVPALNSLNVSHNLITRLDKDLFHGNPALHHLDFSYNDIEEIPEGAFKNLKGLKFLDISYNVKLGKQLGGYSNLLSSPLGFHKNLTTFKANYINLTHVSKRFFENLTLTTVSLADNNLVDVPIFPNTLKYLDLSGNNFKHIDAHHMDYTSLKTLNLNRLYNLENIKPYAFYNLQSLEILSIEYCPRLKHFDNLVFGRLVDGETWSMKEMSLAGNGLKSLNDTYHKMFSKLDKVNLDDNPWVCDCDILWFGLLENKISQTNLRCASPKKLRNRYISSLSEKTIPQCQRGSGWRTHKMLVITIAILTATLMAVILYLIYLGPFRTPNNQIHPIGNLSPYKDIVFPDEQIN